MKTTNIEDIYSLASTQREMLFWSLVPREAGTFVGQFSCLLRGRLNYAAFEAAWRAVIQRHSILRTAFIWERVKEHMQVVMRSAGLPVRRYDCSSVPNLFRDGQLGLFLKKHREKDFDLRKAPLLRISLIEAEENTLRFILEFHHILLDGWSVPIVVGEMLHLYSTFCQGIPGTLPPTRPYKEYIVWLWRQDLSTARSFWEERLRGFSSPTPLPLDHSRGSRGLCQQAHAREEFRLPQDVSTALQSMAREHRFTISTLLQGAWGLLLGCHCGERDIVFGATVSGRSPKIDGIESMVGLFINTLPVRLAVDANCELLSWLENVQRRHAEMCQYEYTPLLDIQRWSAVKPGTLLFDSIVVCENYPVDMSLRQGVVDLALEDVRADEMTPFALSLLASPDLRATLIYDQRRFSKATIIRLLLHFRRILESLPLYVHRRLGEIPFLTEPEGHQLLVEWNDTEAAYPENAGIHELFEAQTARTPDAIALAFGTRQVSYRELNRRADCLANHLRCFGVGPETVVGVCLDRSLEMVVALLGILKAGGAYLPLDPGNPGERLKFQVDDAGVKLLLTQAALAERFRGWQVPTIRLDVGWEKIAATAYQCPVTTATPRNLAYVIYTSGSTGRPKGVMVDHRALCNQIVWLARCFELSGADAVLQKTSFTFDASVWEFFAPLAVGARLVLADLGGQGDTDYLVNAIREYGITFLEGVPALLRVLCECADLVACHSLRTVFSGGEALLPEVRDHFQASSKARLCNTYGPTETCNCITYCSCDRGQNQGLVPIGRPIANTQIYIAGPDGEPAPTGVCGELRVGGVCLARGYLGQPDTTAECFIPNPFGGASGERLYCTGDLTQYLPDGNIEFIGRRDGQVKIRGCRIEVGEVEAVLSCHPAVSQVVVAPQEGASHEKRLVAYVTGRDGEIPETSELRRFLQEHVPDYMIPSVFVSVPSLPMTASGKIDRCALPALCGARPALAEEYVAPRTDTERTLAETWSQVLGCSQVGIHDNFFELGGDSLLVVRVLYEAQNRGLKVTIRQMLEHQTIEELAQVATAAEDEGMGSATHVGPAPLLPSQQWLLERNLPDPQNYNEAWVLKTTRRFSARVLEQAVRSLSRHHDTLHVRLERVPQGWRQVFEEPGHGAVFSEVDLTSLARSHRVRLLPVLLREARRSLNLAAGPLVRFVHFRLGPYGAGRLLVVVSHMVHDGMSAIILLSDLAMAYRSVHQGVAPQLLPPTTSSKLWAERLYAYAQTSDARAELDFWLGQPWPLVTPLPVDGPGGPSANTYESSATIDVSLSRQETESCIVAIARAYEMPVEDLLLGALGQCVSRWAAVGLVLVDVTVSGREPLFSDVDPSRVMGYFTTVYPMVLDLRDDRTASDLLACVKLQLDRVPHRGLGYGVLRYLSNDEQTRRRLAQLPEPQIKFNYTGRFSRHFDAEAIDVPFRPARESVPGVLNKTDLRKYVLNFETTIQDGQLLVSVKYSRNMHKAETITALCDAYLRCLRSLARRRPGAFCHT
jgi:amino acid adenylation domain-containing protein/non-ribosomal peptide synthase protein (TIGR01720 family)